jgi:hypothetical protein
MTCSIKRRRPLDATPARGAALDAIGKLSRRCAAELLAS